MRGNLNHDGLEYETPGPFLQVRWSEGGNTVEYHRNILRYHCFIHVLFHVKTLNSVIKYTYITYCLFFMFMICADMIFSKKNE